jgi:hypothetical protein
MWCSGRDEGVRGRSGLRKRQAVGGGSMGHEGALMAALQRTSRVCVCMPMCWRGCVRGSGMGVDACG